MFSLKRCLPIAAAFSIPVFCCFIGIGAFLQVIVSAMDQQREMEAAARDQEHVAREQRLNDDLTEMKTTAGEVEQSIRAEEQRIAELLRQLGLAQQDQKRGRDLQSQTAAQRTRLAELLDQMATSREQLAALERELAQLREAEKVQRGQLASKRELETRLEEAERRYQQLIADLKQVQRDIEDEKKIVLVTELPGSARLSRKPVYVECTAQMAILQPQGTPLAAVPDGEDRTTFLEAAKRTQYVVFMIRPSGFHCFHKYRDLITSANENARSKIDFGFEPINAESQLVYPGQED